MERMEDWEGWGVKGDLREGKSFCRFFGALVVGDGVGGLVSQRGAQQ